MSNTYDRTVCAFCLHQTICDKLRKGETCHDCPDNLKCGTENNWRNAFCDQNRDHWKTLPRKCLLFDQVIDDAATGGGGVLDPAERTPDGKDTCPRCGCKDARWHSNVRWMLDLASSKMRLTYRFVCPFCGLDETRQI